jgi:hypothetical protein
MKVCKQVVIAATAVAFNKPTIFLDNDIMIQDFGRSVLPDLCMNFLNLLCRLQFNKAALGRRINTGVMCVNPAAVSEQQLRQHMETVYDIAACLNETASDQYAYEPMYIKYWEGKYVGCIDDDEFGNPEVRRLKQR